jgi:hypothetical protein
MCDLFRQTKEPSIYFPFEFLLHIFHRLVQCIGAAGAVYEETANGGEGALIPAASRFVGITYAWLLIFTQLTGS